MAEVNELEKDIWRDDQLDIKENVIGFAHILEQEKYIKNGTSKVYSISAEFGIGKTFFCERLQDVLRQDGVPVSMLNIWKMDFYENPLIPILIKLQEVYIKNNKIRVWVSNRLKFGGRLISWIIKKSLKYCGFNIDKLAKLYKQLKPSKISLYNSYIEYEEQLYKTKNFLASWAKRINKPIVIIIDELDRCRPDYAVKTLEMLKHFFDIPGFVFVLAIDETQLKCSVEKLFGTKNFDGYKRKFINNSFMLPKPDIVKFTDFLYEKSGLADIIKQIETNEKELVFLIRRDSYHDYINKYFLGANNTKEMENCVNFNKIQTTESIIKRYFAAYSIWFKFTLRQMEQTFDRLVLFSKELLGSNTLFSPDLAVLLVCLHEFDLQIYSKLKEKEITGYSDSLFHIIIGSQTSIAFKLYDRASFDMIDKLDRKLIPECPNIPDFSAIGTQNQTRLVIHDNVERFFIIDADNPLKWLRDATIDRQKNPIDNKCRIGLVVHSKDEEKWVKIEPDINTESAFDLKEFRQSYFAKMDFISNFK